MARKTKSKSKKNKKESKSKKTTTKKTYRPKVRVVGLKPTRELHESWTNIPEREWFEKKILEAKERYLQYLPRSLQYMSPLVLPDNFVDIMVSLHSRPGYRYSYYSLGETLRYLENYYGLRGEPISLWRAIHEKYPIIDNPSKKIYLPHLDVAFRKTWGTYPWMALLLKLYGKVVVCDGRECRLYTIRDVEKALEEAMKYARFKSWEEIDNYLREGRELGEFRSARPEGGLLVLRDFLSEK